MRAVSDKFLEAVKVTHELYVRVEVEGEQIPVLEGSTVTLDGNANIRGRCDLRLPPEYEPMESGDLLAPEGNEINIWRGIMYPDNTHEEADLGVFRIEEADIAEEPQPDALLVPGQDRAIQVTDGIFEEARTFAGGSDYIGLIRQLVTESIPDVEVNFLEREIDTILLEASQGEDRWQFVRDMATAAGWELYFDGSGVLVIRLIPSPSDPHVFQISEGDGGVLLGRAKRWSRTDAHNIFIWVGENPDNDTPPTGKAEDLDPNSPTYVHGPFGRVPKIENSSFLVDDTMAQQAAVGSLQKERGTSRSLSFTSVVNPALEPGDVVRVIRNGQEENHIIDSLTIPLSAGESMTAQTRSVLVQ